MTPGLVLGLVLVAVLLLSAPIAVAMGLAAFGAGSLLPGVDPVGLVLRMHSGVDSFPLLAVPLFMLAGELMVAGGISRRIVDLADLALGRLPGGLSIAAVAASLFFAGVSGSAAADAAAVGAVLIPAMLSRGYGPAHAAAVQAAGGSLGVLIPPSIPLIIYGAMTGASITKLFLASVVPGVLVALLLMATAALTAPATTRTTRPRHSGHPQAPWSVVVSALPSLGAPVLILGGILGGVFTATESAAAAVAYAALVGFLLHKELTPAALPACLRRAVLLSASVLFLVATAAALSWVLHRLDTPERMAEFLTSFTHEPFLLLLLVNAGLLLAGTILETTAAIILFTPVLLPLLPHLGLSEIQLGVLLVLNLAIGMLTPPMGICLIVTSSIAGTGLGRTARAVWPFLLPPLAVLLLVSCFPGLLQLF